MSSTEPQGAAPGTASVGIIIPSYGAELYIEDTLRSVQAQTFDDWECIVVDDGSPDNSAEVTAKYIADDPRFRLVDQENRGVAGARNSGLAMLSPSVRYVAILDCDDLWEPDALEILHQALVADPEAVATYGYAEFVDQNGEPFEPGLHPGRQRNRQRMVGPWPRRVGPLEPADFAEIVINSPVWPPAVALFRRDVMDRVGEFDTDQKQLDDYDYTLRLARHGHFRPIGKQVAWYRQHTGQMTKDRSQFWFYHDVCRHKTWSSPENSPEQRRIVARAWRVAQLRRIARCGVRLAGAARHRRWSDTRRLLKGMGVLLAQATRPGPPEANIDHIRWTGRNV